MYCDQCGEENRSNARYCSACRAAFSPTTEGQVGKSRRRWIAIGAVVLLLVVVLGAVLIPRVAQATGKAQLRPILLKQIDEYERRVAKANGMPANPVCWNIPRPRAVLRRKHISDNGNPMTSPTRTSCVITPNSVATMPG
jgi:hypothetical protein